MSDVRLENGLRLWTDDRGLRCGEIYRHGCRFALAMKPASGVDAELAGAADVLLGELDGLTAEGVRLRWLLDCAEHDLLSEGEPE